jgi:hypothetical protein
MFREMHTLSHELSEKLKMKTVARVSGQFSEAEAMAATGSSSGCRLPFWRNGW